MKKNLLTIALLIIASMSISKAQYYTTHYDPFVNGEKSFGISVGSALWFGSSDFLLKTGSKNYTGFNAEKLTRSLFSPSFMIHYKRVLEGNKINWGNSYYIGYFTWSGTVTGTSATDPNLTFTTDYKSSSAELVDFYYAMVPVGDQISINAGIGLALGLNLDPKSTIKYSDGRTDVETKGGLEFIDLLKANIGFLVGADYKLSDSFILNCTLLGYPIDFFGSLNDDEATKGKIGVGEGLYVSKKFPAQLTIGFTYAL